MNRAKCLLATAMTLALLLGAPVAAAAASDLSWQDAPAVVFDVMILRPLSAIATIVGAPLFVATVPFVALEGQIMTSLDVFVLAPADYTITRPLGDF
jgi:hypothetical protein